PSTTKAYTWRPGGRRRDTTHFPLAGSRESGVATGFHSLKLPTSATCDARGAESSNRTTSRSADGGAGDTRCGDPALAVVCAERWLALAPARDIARYVAPAPSATSSVAAARLPSGPNVTDQRGRSA